MFINSLSFIKALTLDFLNFSKLEVKHHFDPFFFKLNEEHFTSHLEYHILVRLLTINIKNFVTPEIRECVTLFY